MEREAFDDAVAQNLGNGAGLVRLLKFRAQINNLNGSQRTVFHA